MHSKDKAKAKAKAERKRAELIFKAREERKLTRQRQLQNTTQRNGGFSNALD